jgi:hypothetical protein
MRTFISRRFGPWRLGASFGPEDWRPRRLGRGRPVLFVATTTTMRPRRSYYGLALDQPDPSAELPAPEHVFHPGRDLLTIVTTLAWLALHLLMWLALAALGAIAGLAIVAAALVRY